MANHGFDLNKPCEDWEARCSQKLLFYLLLMEAYKFSEIVRLLNMSLQYIPLRFYHIHLRKKTRVFKWETESTVQSMEREFMKENL